MLIAVLSVAAILLALALFLRERRTEDGDASTPAVSVTLPAAAKSLSTQPTVPAHSSSAAVIEGNPGGGTAAAAPAETPASKEEPPDDKAPPSPAGGDQGGKTAAAAPAETPASKEAPPDDKAPPSPPVGGINSPADDAEIQSALPMVVAGVHCITKDGREGDWPLVSGTGFVVTPDGYVVTNEHVIEGVVHGMKVKDGLEWLGRYVATMAPAQESESEEDRAARYIADYRKAFDSVTPKIWLLVDGKQLEADIVFSSEAPDVAVLKCGQRFSNFFRLAAGFSSKPVGSNVWPVGYPGVASNPLTFAESQQNTLQQTSARKACEYYTADQLRHTTTKGVFSRLRDQPASGSGPMIKLIVHDAKIDHGSSGGPLLDDSGRVLGINTYGLQEGYFFALSMPDLRELLRQYVGNATWE